jgi:hypothetical protein
MFGMFQRLSPLSLNLCATRAFVRVGHCLIVFGAEKDKDATLEHWMH